MRNARANDFDDIPRPALPIANDYPPAFELERHVHTRGQLVYAAEGVITVDTDQAPGPRRRNAPCGFRPACRMR